MKKKVLHVGPALTKGGMGRTIQRLHNNPPDNWISDFVTTHSDGNWLAILKAWIRGKKEFLNKIKDRPDLIHVHTATRASWFRKRKIIRLANQKNIPVIVHLHSGAFDKFGKGWIGNDISKTLSLPKVHPIVLSKFWKEWLDSKISNEVKIVPNPFRQGLTPNKPKNRDIQMLLMVGRPSPNKGHSIAINAIEQLRRERVEISLYLAGTKQNDLEKKLRFKDGIIPKGWVSDKELDILIKKAGFLLMPSEHEGMPLSLLDALATGLPAIVSKTCSSFINEGGVVIEERSVMAWKKGIMKQIQDYEEWEKMVKNAPNDVAGLDSNSDKERWGEIYNEITNLMNH